MRRRGRVPGTFAVRRRSAEDEALLRRLESLDTSDVAACAQVGLEIVRRERPGAKFEDLPALGPYYLAGVQERFLHEMAGR